MPYRPQKVHFRAPGGIFRLAHCAACSVFGLHLRNQAVRSRAKPMHHPHHLALGGFSCKA